MKKFVTMVIAFALIMSLIVAQAEVRYSGSAHDEMKNAINGVVEDEHYYVNFDLDYTGEYVRIEVDRDTYEKITNDHDLEVEHHNSLWYVKAWNWTANAACDVVDFVTFWN